MRTQDFPRRSSPAVAVTLIAAAAACGTGPAASRAPYRGLVVATVTQTATTQTYGASAAFVETPSTQPGASQACSCAGDGTEILGYPLPQLPDAGTLTVGSPMGAVLATLAPTPEVTNGSMSSGGYHIVRDIGLSSWDGVVSSYLGAASQPWRPGDALQISASGDQVSPFFATLQTGVPLAGITPAIAAPGSPLHVSRSADFEISWTPEGAGKDVVLLTLGQIGETLCSCTAPDAAGSITMSSTLLAQVPTQGSTDPAASVIELARVTTSTVTSGNVTVDLVGMVQVTGAAAFE